MQPRHYHGFNPLLPGTDQIHRQVCFFPPLEHRRSPALIPRLRCWDPDPCFHCIPSELLWWSPVRGSQQNAGQAPACTKLNCQGFHSHQTLASHHPHRCLHWLLVRYRILYKLLLLAYKCLHSLTLCNLSDLLHQYTPALTLQSADCIPGWKVVGTELWVWPYSGTPSLPISTMSQPWTLLNLLSKPIFSPWPFPITSRFLCLLVFPPPLTVNPRLNHVSALGSPKCAI